MTTDTNVILIPFNPAMVPLDPKLPYIEVEPQSRKEWMERKGLKWEPYEDPFFWQLAFNPEVAMPSMAPAPHAESIRDLYAVSRPPHGPSLASNSRALGTR